MSKAKDSRAGLSARDIEKYRALLLAKRSEILSSVWSMEEGSIRRSSTELSTLPMHMADLGSDNFEVENTIGLVESERRILVEIDEALQRIENGTFGICEGLGEPIGKRRLEAIPWARYCVKCASLHEAGQLFHHEAEAAAEPEEEQDQDQEEEEGEGA
ncbi:MAG TPA: TraR/DksA family transcriptional regulator [Phycisphaerales bacterium]|nr:TraR/DksA family transcriptional regulator [Phycisphaerales bacterium]